MPSLLHSVFQTGIERHESLLAYFQDRELLRSIVSALNDIEILTDLWLYPIEDEAGFVKVHRHRVQRRLKESVWTPSPGL